jgi:PIN domain nuclease of toxin-antitoxin system
VRLLLDSHSLIWAVDDPSKLGPKALSEMPDPSNELVVSAATIWELSIKCGLGKLALSMAYRPWMEKAIGDLRALVLPISIEHAALQSSLPWHHRDPFDRLLAAQAKIENMPIVSKESIFDQYGVARLW